MPHNDSSAPRVWFITGCSSGLGLALAEGALGNGDRVVATARQPGTLANLATRYPETCRALPLDVTDPAQVQQAITSAVSVFERIDVVVNNAGYGLTGAFEELSEEQITRNFDTNFFGALSVIRAALPSLRAQGAGHIINISAAAVIGNYPGFSIYGATKWALEGVSESLAAELKPLGIKVTLVQPGPFRTKFIGSSMEKGAASIPDYAPTSGRFLRVLEGMAGKQLGDPSKAATAIISAVGSPEPPLRLVLGKYAHDKVRKKLSALASELEAWAPIGLPTDFSHPS